MIKLPHIDTPQAAAILCKYASCVGQRTLPFLGNERHSRKVELDAAFALGLTCGLELAELSAHNAKLQVS